jgi:predicted transcriptional regulator of viral defense system
MEIDKIDSIYLTRQNLKLLLGSNRRTLDYRISSFIKKGILSRLKKGFYLNLKYFDRSQTKEQLLEYVGQTMVYPSYLSGEYVLSEKGFLAESVYGLTYVTTKKTRQIITSKATFIYKKIKSDLFFGFETKKIDDYNYNIATLPKALFDMIYLVLGKNKQEIEKYLMDSRFNWKSLGKKEKLEFKKIIVQTKIKKMQETYEFLKKKGVV